LARLQKTCLAKEEAANDTRKKRTGNILIKKGE